MTRPRRSWWVCDDRGCAPSATAVSSAWARCRVAPWASRPKIDNCGPSPIEWEKESRRSGIQYLVLEREGEPLRHDANDGMVHLAQLHGCVERGGIRAEPAAPHRIADHHDGCRARPFIVRADDTAHHRGDTGHCESRGGHLGYLDRFRCSGRDDQVLRQRPEGADVLHRRELLSPGQEILLHERLRLVLLRVPLLKRDDAVPLRQRQIRGTQLLADDREHRHGNGDRDRDTEDCDGTQRRMADQHPDGQTEIGAPADEQAQCGPRLEPGQSHGHHTSTQGLAAPLGAKSDRTGNCVAPVTRHGARGAVSGTVAMEQFDEVARDVFAHVARHRVLDQPSRETRRARSRWRHLMPRRSRSSPCHI